MSVSGIRGKALLFAAPALLSVVACYQRYLVVFHSFPAWKGGGFGMFATVPQRRLRVLTVTLVTPNDREIRILSRRFKNNSPSILEERAGLSRIIRKIITMPTEDRLKAMARDLAEAEWELVRMTRGSVERTVPMLRPEDASWGKSKEFPLKAIRVDLWEYEFDAEAVRLNLTHPLAVTERVGRFREQAERGR